MDRDEYLRVKNGVYDWLCAMKNDPDNGIAAIYSSKKAKSWERILNVHLCWRQDAAFIFRMNWIQQRFRHSESNSWFSSGQKRLSNHFMAVGPDIIPGMEIEEMSLLDEGPTMAEIMGLSLPDADGRILHEIFKNQ